MKRRIEPFKGMGNDICKSCRFHIGSMCEQPEMRNILIHRAVELEEATRNNPIEFKRLDAYWGFLAAMSELNECKWWKDKHPIKSWIKQLVGSGMPPKEKK